jgi:hypothetical protein
MSSAKCDIRKIESDGGSTRMLAYAFLAASLLLNTRAPAYLVLLYAFACVVPALASYVHSVRQRNGDVEPEWMKAGATSHAERREFRQRLPHNPFGPDDRDRILDERITEAAELCVQYGRKAIVVTLTFDDISSDELSAAAVVAQQIVRKTDLVAIVSSNEIVIGLAMVHDFAAAGLVTARLRRALASPVLLSGIRVSCGAAIYPLHGYSGEELIAAARRSARSWTPLLAA